MKMAIKNGYVRDHNKAITLNHGFKILIMGRGVWSIELTKIRDLIINIINNIPTNSCCPLKKD